jgi:hypothetical protein
MYSKRMTLSKPVHDPAILGPLDRIVHALKGDMAKVNSLILEKMQSDVPLIRNWRGT